jgi:hypothetical protein
MLNPPARGSTIKALAESPSAVRYVFTHSWGKQEAEAASERAEAHCRRFGRRARLVEAKPGWMFLDRTVVEFACVTE